MKKEDYLNAVERNSKRIYLIALSYLKSQYDAEDVMQETFMKLWKTKKEFNDIEHIDKWLTINCVSKCKDYFRYSFVKHTATTKEIEKAYCINSEDKIDIFNSIISLSKNDRLVIHLFYYENMSINEIAKVIKTSPSSVKTRLCRARKTIKNHLGDDWINE